MSGTFKKKNTNKSQICNMNYNRQSAPLVNYRNYLAVDLRSKTDIFFNDYLLLIIILTQSPQGYFKY